MMLMIELTFLLQSCVLLNSVQLFLLYNDLGVI